MAEEANIGHIDTALKKPVAGVPGYVWVVGGAIGVAITYYRRKKAAAPATVADTGLAGGDTGTDQSLATNNASIPTTSSNTTGPNATITNNDDWYRAAEIALLAKGYSPTTVDNALRKYLDSQPLDRTDGAVISAALSAIGPPPQALPILQPTPNPVTLPVSHPVPVKTPVTQPKPVVKPPVKPATHTIQHGETLWGLVQTHYGRVNTDMVNRVAAANHLSWDANHTHVSPWKDGQIITFPPL